MLKDIIIEQTNLGKRICILENNILEEIYFENSLINNVYLGKVIRILPSMNVAFIDIGLEKAGFLYLDDKNNFFTGQSILVQIIKEAKDSKGAKLSTEISFSSKYLVYFLNNKNSINISHKIDKEKQQILKNNLQELINNNFKNKNIQGEFVLRTNSENANNDELIKDINYLTNIWLKIQIKIKSLNEEKKINKRLIYQVDNLIYNIFNDINLENNLNNIYINSKDLFSELNDFIEENFQDLKNKLVLTKDLLFFNIENQIKKALNKRVDLPSGGYLIIEKTEALISVDVNTGSFTGNNKNNNFESIIFQTNLEASFKIAQQLKLRNLSGIIIIDFIDMNNNKNKYLLLNEFKKYLEKDKIKTKIANKFSRLGLLEMTRKRTRESLEETLGFGFNK